MNLWVLCNWVTPPPKDQSIELLITVESVQRGSVETTLPLNRENFPAQVSRISIAVWTTKSSVKAKNDVSSVHRPPLNLCPNHLLRKSRYHSLHKRRYFLVRWFSKTATQYTFLYRFWYGHLARSSHLSLSGSFQTPTLPSPQRKRSCHWSRLYSQYSQIS